MEGGETLTSVLLSQGVLGVVTVALAYFVMILRADLRDTRQAHKVEIAEKDELINELQEKRLAESREGYKIAAANKETLDAFLLAIKQGRG